jgi:Transglycosylase-like domain/Putative peptidoglycan binding domain
MATEVADAAMRARTRASLARSRSRREWARRLRRRRLRLRGSALSLAAVALCVAALGVGAAAGRAGVLERGDRGAAVVALQHKLHVRADGVFGRATERALKRFQRRHGITADGVVGAATRRALGLRVARASSVTTGGSQAQGGTTPTGRLPSVLVRIAECESGGDPAAVSRDGRYRGKYQFTRSMWRSMGGRGDPAAASESLQDRLALRLYRRRGTAPWPTCG